MSLPRRRFLAGAGAGAAALLTTGARARSAADFGALARAVDGRVVLPADRDYPEARRLFQPRFDSVRPGAVAYPAHAGDVAVCLEFARRAAVPVVPRGGGHSYPGWSTVEAGLVIDTGAMAGVTVEGDGVRVGAGARLADVHGVLAGRGLGLPAGLCPSVGIAGLALGGGLGIASRAHGTTSDRLTGARVVTADALVREVDADHDPALYWALRGGGGGNFGVVTEFRFRTHPVSEAAFAELHWSDGDSPAVLRGWQRWLAGLPDPFWSQVEFTSESGSGPGPGQGRGRGRGGGAVPAVRVLSLDGRGELERELARLTGLVAREPRDAWVVVRGYGDTVRAMAGCSGSDDAACRLPGRLPGRDPRGTLTRDSYAARSDFWGGAGLPDAAIEVVLDAVARHARAVPRGGRGVVQFDGVCGGAVNRVPATATAFAHRDSAFLAQYLVYWPESAPAPDVARHRAWLDGLWRDLRPWAGGSAYQNYADPLLTGWREAYYGPNLARLEEVRRTHDPDRLFRFPQAV
ncbi:FAD-binding oxidoreductase [Streptomyces sp. NPDC048606]|uniref:FAD-binding oxidoreductase n=1 Tax=Streptomyces sp. NPDC048606 TaxID=3154726 RepID=UPI00343528F6